jgi:DNA-binding HxlR family transcriptional regulator
VAHTDFAQMNCSVARALGEVGERWSLLIIREAMMGSTRFDQFQTRLGVARNILTERLKSLVVAGVLARRKSKENARIFTYTLTEKGSDLLPVIAALMGWGDRWISFETGPPVLLVDRETFEPLLPVALRRTNGQAIAVCDIAIKAGAGADSKTKARLVHGLDLTGHESSPI